MWFQKKCTPPPPPATPLKKVNGEGCWVCLKAELEFPEEGGGGWGERGATKTPSVGGEWIDSGATKSKFLQVNSTWMCRLVATYKIHMWLVFIFLLDSLKIDSKKSHVFP